MTVFLVPNYTPKVGSWSCLNLPSVKRSNKHDLPTPYVSRQLTRITYDDEFEQKIIIIGHLFVLYLLSIFIYKSIIDSNLTPIFHQSLWGEPNPNLFDFYPTAFESDLHSSSLYTFKQTQYLFYHKLFLWSFKFQFVWKGYGFDG